MNGQITDLRAAPECVMQGNGLVCTLTAVACLASFCN